MSTEKAILLITGATQGLGYFAAAQLSRSGAYHVLVGGRTRAKAEAAITQLVRSGGKDDDADAPADPANLSPLAIDVDSDASVAEAVAEVERTYGRLDVLINNAGISRAVGVHSDLEPNADGSGPGLREQYAQIYGTNVFGVAVVIEGFLPLMRKSTVAGGRRIVCTGSGTASLERSRPRRKGEEEKGKGADGRLYRIYRSSKTALNMLVVSYACELAEEGFVVTAANPGYCATNLNLHKGLRDPREGAAIIVGAVTAEEDLAQGRMIDENGVVEW